MGADADYDTVYDEVQRFIKNLRMRRMSCFTKTKPPILCLAPYRVLAVVAIAVIINCFIACRGSALVMNSKVLTAGVAAHRPAHRTAKFGQIYWFHGLYFAIRIQKQVQKCKMKSNPFWGEITTCCFIWLFQILWHFITGFFT